MTTPASHRPSGPPDRAGFRGDPSLTGGLELWANGTHAELDALLSTLDSVGRVLWRSERRRLHEPADAGRHSVYLRLAVAAEPRPIRTGRPEPSGGPIDLAAARRRRASA